MELGPGEVVIGRGDASDAAYMVQSGSFECYDDTDENKIVRTYAVGEVFGELGVLLNQERVLSIKASASGGKVLKLTKQDVDIAVSSMSQSSGQKDVLSNLMEERYIDYFDEKKKAKSLKKCPLFKKISPDDVARIQAAMVLETFQDDELVFALGDVGDSMYFVKSGSFECFDETAKESVAFVKAGEYFGELSLLLGQKRALSVRAVGEAEAWSLSKEEFLNCVLDSPIFDSALTTIKENYGLRTVWDIVLTLSPTELKELAVTGSRPKKASVSRHSTLSTVAAGFLFASLLPMFSPGFYSNGFPRIYDQMLFDNVSLTRITTFLFAVVGATGTFRLPPQTPKLRRLLFEQVRKSFVGY
jgi:CRP-like cAMP-binding protein